MKTRALLIAAMLAPAAYGQSPPTLRNLEPQVLEVYTPIKVRPEKVQPFTDRAVELNKKRAALEEEGKKLGQTPPAAAVEDYNRRVDAWKSEAQAFQRETAEEFRLRRNQAGFVAKSLGSWQDAIDDAAVSLNAPQTPPPAAPGAAATPAPPTPAPAAAKPTATPAQPAATGPKPSSVPGLPPGMEPGKKKTKDLPPGMTRG